jgi:hypothetical protein
VSWKRLLFPCELSAALNVGYAMLSPCSSCTLRLRCPQLLLCRREDCLVCGRQDRRPRGQLSRGLLADLQRNGGRVALRRLPLLCLRRCCDVVSGYRSAPDPWAGRTKIGARRGAHVSVALSTESLRDAPRVSKDLQGQRLSSLGSGSSSLSRRRHKTNPFAAMFLSSH